MITILDDKALYGNPHVTRISAVATRSPVLIQTIQPGLSSCSGDINSDGIGHQQILTKQPEALPRNEKISGDFNRLRVDETGIRVELEVFVDLVQVRTQDDGHPILTVVGVVIVR